MANSALIVFGSMRSAKCNCAQSARRIFKKRTLLVEAVDCYVASKRKTCVAGRQSHSAVRCVMFSSFCPTSVDRSFSSMKELIALDMAKWNTVFCDQRLLHGRDEN